MYAIFKEEVPADKISFPSFFKVVAKYSNRVIPMETAEEVFQIALDKHGGRDYLKWTEFEDYFKLKTPNPGMFQDQAAIIQKVKEWMQGRQYSAQQAYERLLKTSGKGNEQMGRYEFHKAVVDNELKLTAPEIDFLFDFLTGFRNLSSTRLGVKDWL